MNQRRLTMVVICIAPLLAGAAGAACTKPSPPLSTDGLAAYGASVEAWIACHHENEVLRPLEQGTISYEAYQAAKADHERVADDAFTEMAAVAEGLRSRESSRQPAAAMQASISTGADCAQLERESTARLHSIESRLNRASGLCEQYGLAVELGETGAQMYAACPILDPSGDQLGAAQQMIDDGIEGQRAVCVE